MGNDEKLGNFGTKLKQQQRGRTSQVSVEDLVVGLAESLKILSLDLTTKVFHQQFFQHRLQIFASYAFHHTST
jgi:hypothetical protein